MSIGPAIIKVPWTKQPPAGTQVDGPLAPDIFLFSNSKGVRRSVLDNIGPTSDSAINHIDGVEFTGTTGEGVDFNTTSNFVPAQEGSITFYIRAITTPTNFDTFFEFTATTEFTLQKIADSGGNRISLFLGDTLDLVVPNLYDGKPHLVTIVYRNVSDTVDQLCYMDGVLVDTVSLYLSNTYVAITAIDIVQDVDGFGGTGYVINNVMFHGRNLTAPEVRSLHADVLQIFKPRTIFIGKPNNEKLVVF